MGKQKTAVVLGGYGFIGSACIRALKAAGYTVFGVGRSGDAARACDPDIDWIIRDIAATTEQQWLSDLQDVDVVVNASGALQDGSRDNLQTIHETAVSGLSAAAGRTGAKLVHISAAGVSETANTNFMRSKWRGDQMVMDSNAEWVVLRPVLVFGAQAYGGTALLRAAAAMPGVGMKMLADVPVQTVHVDDVAQAVVQAANGEIASGTVCGLTEEGTQTFDELVQQVRAWLGFPPWRFRLDVPPGLLKPVSAIADLLGWLGWRSPLRSTAVKSLANGITGDAMPFRAAGGKSCRPFRQTLADIPAGTQERWFARLYLLLPLAIACLAVFWIASGVIGLVEMDKAKQVLTQRGFDGATAGVAVVAGSLLDILLGIAVLFRKHVRTACAGMVALSVGYVAAATLWTPDLWCDPLGPMVKVLPGIVLALLVAALIEDR